MIDFNSEETQKAAGGAIPEDSIVWVRLNLRQPKEAQRTRTHPLVMRSKGTQGGVMLGLDAEYEVAAGEFEGRKIWDYLWLPSKHQPEAANLTDNQRKAVQIAGRKLRGIVEAHRAIHPKDESPNAAKMRGITDWADLNGMEFGVMVGVSKPQPGDKYVNNYIKRIITIDHRHYTTLRDGKEVITDNPIPAIPSGGGHSGGDPFGDDPGYAQTPTGAYDDSPF